MRRRRLRAVAEEASSKSSANLREVQWASGVTFRAFSVSGDGVGRSVGELVALVGGSEGSRTSRADRSVSHEKGVVIGQNLGEEEVCLRC